ncbi:NTE family protein [Acholeplasma morum]|uniref:patatin-like phospholipase family protein n=1 Tax=Paracholeplasma morum TaxID=264637 RepID=UPI00195925E0|nr:patatin-like phospholipase family protein [Paracholeplasma morum]MBM7453656.1 NTE family protein [Paracholeplasma morum]
MKPKIGLMLGGGGAKGGYQLGVIRALEEHNLLDDIEVVAGTSIGAINGLLLCTLNDANKIVEVWEYAQESGFYKQGFTRFKQDKQGLYSLDVLRDIFTHYVKLKDLTKCDKDLYVVASKIIDPKKIVSQIRKDNHEKTVFHVNTHEKPFETVIASASIPLFFGTTYIDEDGYVDGGLTDNNPIDVLIDKGCNVIITVPLDYNLNLSKYINDKILIVNMTDLSLFSNKPVQMAYDIIRFTDDALTERQNYGYFVANEVINNLIDIGILNEDSSLKDSYRSISKFTYIEPSAHTYEKIKELKKQRVITKKEEKKRTKIKTKLSKKIERGKKDGNS